MSVGGIRAGGAWVELSADDSKLARSLKMAERKLKSFGASVAKVGAAMTGFAVAAAAPIALATRTFVGFSDQMKAVQAITGATGKEFDILNEKAKTLGRTTSFTASQVAGAMVELGRAGFSTSEIDSAIAGMLDLSRATGTDLARATEIAGNTLRGFNMAANESGRASDVLTATANNSAQTLEDLGEALKMVAPIAVTAGASLEDTAASIGILANNGIKGTMAGTALARAYKNLSKSSVSARIAELGVATADANGNLRPMSSILADIGAATANLGSAEKLGIYEEVFGRASASAIKLSESSGQFGEFVDKLKNSQGVAAATAETMDSGLGGSFRRLMSAVEGIAIAVGEGLAPMFMSWAETLSGVAGWITKVVAKNGELIKNVVKIIAIIGAAGVALTVIGGIIIFVGMALGALATITSVVIGLFGILTTIIGAILSPIGLIVIAIGAVVAALVMLGVWISNITGFTDKAVGFLGKKFQALKDMALKSFGGIADAMAAGNMGLAAKILWLTLKVAWQKGIGFLQGLWAKFKSWFVKISIEAFYGALIVLNNVVSGIQKAWANLTGWLGKQWATIKAGAASVWNLVALGAEKMVNRIKSAFDEDFDVDAANNAAEEQFVSRQRAIDSKTKAEQERIERERDQRLGAIERDRSGTENVLVGQADEAERKNQERRDAALQASEDKLNETRGEWDTAIAQAARERAEGEAGSDDPDTAPQLDPAAIQNQIAGGAAKASSTASLASGQGTFFANALRGLVNGKTKEEEIVAENKRTADATERMARNLENGGVAIVAA